MKTKNIEDVGHQDHSTLNNGSALQKERTCLQLQFKAYNRMLGSFFEQNSHQLVRYRMNNYKMSEILTPVLQTACTNMYICLADLLII